MTMELPKTIEGALYRYMTSYEKSFPDQRDIGDIPRLKGYVEEKAALLMKKAPNFYEDRLPRLVNQAASRILMINFDRPESKLQFHRTHRSFIKILDELLKTQPAGEVDFEVELKRIEVKDKLRKDYTHLRRQMNELEAKTFDLDVLGDEAGEASWSRFMSLYEAKKAQFKEVAYKLALMDGHEVEEEIVFQLGVKSGTVLDSLTNEQKFIIEREIIHFVKSDNTRKTGLFQSDVIDGIIKQLNLDPSKFTSENRAELSRDIHESYKEFFRKRALERSINYLDYIASCKALQPTEGIILRDMDDITDEVRQRLEESEKKSKRDFDLLNEECLKRARMENESYTDLGEGLDDDSSTDLGDEDDLAQVKKEVSERPDLFLRVKDEPRDDYDNDAPSDEEILVDENEAQDLRATLSLSGEPSTDRSGRHQELYPPNNISNKNHELGEDDDFQELGIVAPVNKIETIEISDDE